MKNLLFAIVLSGLLSSCEKSHTDPQDIVDRSIEAHGGGNYEDVFVEFDFRNHHYTLERQGESFKYTRILEDTIGTIKDVLVNATNFQRYFNDREVVISSKRTKAFTSSVNSVLYFIQLPSLLNDRAVIKEYLGESVIEGNEYYRVRVTFKQIGGGENFEDVFCFWFNKETFTVDYFAYSYSDDEGIGSRFRKAINPRRVGGILFQDYINYRPRKEIGSQEVEIHDRLFLESQLEELSRIENRNIRVQSLIAPS